jgi:ATP-dependent exoDNAse (exonuclease V) beta subunit
MKPTFKVLYDNFNKNTIEFQNWFDFGQWSVIKRDLSKTIKKLRKCEKLYAHKIGFDEIQPELRKLFKEELWNIEFKRCKNMDELIKYTVEKQLDRQCMYYFWAKCEYEVIVSAWPPKDGSDRKIDIYTQLKENWDIFKELVFRELKLK